MKAEGPRQKLAILALRRLRALHLADMRKLIKEGGGGDGAGGKKRERERKFLVQRLAARDVPFLEDAGKEAAAAAKERTARGTSALAVECNIADGQGAWFAPTWL